MPAPSKPEIFATLNAKRIKTDDQLTLFPETHPHNTCNEYWLYSDLHNLYGEILFPTQPSFSAHIWQNMVMPSTPEPTRAFPKLQPTNIEFYNNHIALITHPYTLDNRHFKSSKDFKLSRYACWCMSRSNPNMIFSRTYFIAPIIDPHMSFEQMNAYCYQFARIHLREQLSRQEKIINAIAYKNKIDFNEFRRINRAALFADHSKSHIAARNDFYISRNTPLADHMGAATLYTRTQALENAIAKINHTQPINSRKILEIIFTELDNARINMTKNLHIRPEDDISRIPVQKTQSLLMQTERDFINKYAHQKMR